MLKLALLIFFLMPTVSMAVVPYTVQDVNIDENFSYINAQLKKLNTSTVLYQLGEGVLYVKNIAKTSTYFLDVATDGALTVTSTTTLVTIPWLLITDRRGTSTCRISVATNGVLQVDILPFVLAGTPTTISTADGRVYALDVLNGNTITLTYLGVFTI